MNSMKKKNTTDEPQQPSGKANKNKNEKKPEKKLGKNEKNKGTLPKNQIQNAGNGKKKIDQNSLNKPQNVKANRNETATATTNKHKQILPKNKNKNAKDASNTNKNSKPKKRKAKDSKDGNKKEQSEKTKKNKKEKNKANEETNASKSNVKSKPIQLSPEATKQKIREWYAQLKESEDVKQYTFTWHCNPVPVEEEIATSRQVVEKGYWAMFEKTFTGKKLKKLEGFLSSTSMTMEQAKSLRNSILQDKVRNTHHKVVNQSKKLHERYIAGESVLSLSRELDCPPLAIYRALLSELGHSKGQIKKIIKAKGNGLDQRSIDELRIAEDNDFISSTDQDQVRKEAQEFEDTLEIFFKEKGIRFITEGKSTDWQKKTVGKAVATPDILFLDNVTINGKQINWIDAKNFYGSSLSKRTVNDSKKQMKKYHDHFGSGAIVYANGFSSDINIPDCLLLDQRGKINFTK
ncbi:hypothetical protein CTEN210_15360 [Chaetoceros tenuissimus]|uniref:CDAN1-interacting nuclease 1 n=1 Tax=Chaetoceros tenuissimus TaxID=426638 RepID=A0AAD3D6S8_9STRA|nr:hypothetical protein CTEN210_15360 [Chaetoceros tenuissimus]